MQSIARCEPTSSALGGDQAKHRTAGQLPVRVAADRVVELAQAERDELRRLRRRVVDHELEPHALALDLRVARQRVLDELEPDAAAVDIEAHDVERGMGAGSQGPAEAGAEHLAPACALVRGSHDLDVVADLRHAILPRSAARAGGFGGGDCERRCTS